MLMQTKKLENRFGKQKKFNPHPPSLPKKKKTIFVVNNMTFCKPC